MVKTVTLKNKDGEVLKTKEGKELVEYQLEKGDTFIPRINKVIENVNVGKDSKTGKEKKITNYSILTKVMDHKTGNLFLNREMQDEVYINLTPTQAKQIKKMCESEDVSLLPNQNILVAYEYFHEDYGENFIGVSYKKTLVPAKDFNDFLDTEVKEEVKEETKK